MTNLYPIKFHPIFKEMIWGSESWDISCRPLEMGVIANGPNAGQIFEDYINLDREKILGTRLKDVARFPLLVKIIDARDALSIQVHPCDEYAKQSGSADSGKSEMWCILKPPTDGHLIIGLKPGVTRAVLETAYKNGTVEDCLNRLPVKAGDMINIPAGLVHAITPGVVLAEVQQNSDITYRLYDYNRMGPDGKTRPLHVQEALDVSDFDEKIPKTVAADNQIKCPYFTVVKYEITTPLVEVTDTANFCIFTCVEGIAQFDTGEVLNTGDSVFLPAAMGKYVISPKGGRAVLLKSHS